MTHKDLADNAGTVERTISRLLSEPTKNPSLFLVASICQALHISLDKHFVKEVYNKTDSQNSEEMIEVLKEQVRQRRKLSKTLFAVIFVLLAMMILYLKVFPNTGQLAFGGLFFFPQKVIHAYAEVVSNLLQCCLPWNCPFAPPRNHGTHKPHFFGDSRRGLPNFITKSNIVDIEQTQHTLFVQIAESKQKEQLRLDCCVCLHYNENISNKRNTKRALNVP